MTVNPNRRNEAFGDPPIQCHIANLQFMPCLVDVKKTLYPQNYISHGILDIPRLRQFVNPLRSLVVYQLQFGW